MSESKYILKGLCCSNCAAKIEENVRKLEGVSSAELNFAAQKLNVKLKQDAPGNDLRHKITSLVKSIEPDVEVLDVSNKTHDPSSQEGSRGYKKDILIIIAGSLLLFSGIFLPLPFPVQLSLFVSAYILSGGKVLIKAGNNIGKGDIFDENFLMTLATLGAFAIGEYPEAVSVMLFYKVGQLLESMAVTKSRSSIQSLLDIRPDYANLVQDSETIRVNPEDVQPGSFILIKPGERVPLDGLVTAGSSFLDTSALTGEAVPRKIDPGDAILSGSININSVLTIKVTKSFDQSTASRILELVQNAAARKAPTESFITRFSRYYTPAVVIAALLFALIPPLASGSLNFSQWIYRALIFLVISCPCALVISIPLSFFGGIGAASAKGILVKGGNYLEALNKVTTVVFDKTGTLTKGSFKVTEIVSEEGFTDQEVLEYAAKAEVHSSHPIAKSILEAYGKEINSSEINSYVEIPGQGIKAEVNGQEILAGNDKILHIDSCIEHNTCHVEGTVVHVAVNRKYAGYILISDEIKEDARKTVTRLRDLGEIRIAMLTGDSEQSARSTARQLNIEEYYFSLLPEDKVRKLEELKQSNFKSRLVFVGDGINDAPVLAASDIGVAMGAMGSDAAIEAADIVLMTDEPFKLVEAIQIARQTHRVVWQNILLAFAVKALVLLLGAFGMATMWEAVFADVGVTVAAVFNTLRIMRK